MVAEFGWWPMSPWLSPGAAWFIFFNILVGAIAVMSSSRAQGQQNGAHESGTRRRLVRTASTVVLDTLRSISIFSFHSAADYSYSVAYSAPAPQLHHVQDRRYDIFQDQEPREAAVPQLLREPETTSVAREESVAAPEASATASESQVGDGESSISLDEAYALARARRQAPTAAAAAADTGASVPDKREPAVARPYGCGRGTDDVGCKAEVNARAEQFIRQFREELKLERINSIQNYTHALRRGPVGSSDRLA